MDAPPPHGYSHGRMIPERAQTIAGASGLRLEAQVAVTAGARAGVVVCHPHPLYGGDMDNPVVGVTIDACRDAGLATLRFNFRGVGGSTGSHDEGRGEQSDAVAALDHLAALLPAGAPVALAGYSFGAGVAAAIAAGGRALGGLALVAPPLAFGSLDRLAMPAGLRGPLLVVAGTADEYCPLAALQQVARALPDADVRIVEGTDHFFTGALGPLVEAVTAWARRVGVRG